MVCEDDTTEVLEDVMMESEPQEEDSLIDEPKEVDIVDESADELMDDMLPPSARMMKNAAKTR